MKNNSRILYPFLLVVLCALVWMRAPTGEYVYDSKPLIAENPSLDHWSNLRHLVSPRFTQTFGDLHYRPLAPLTFFVDAQLCGRRPACSRLINLALHLCTGLALFALWRRVFEDPLLAFLAAALFLVHPLGSEPVLCAGFRKDLLATLAVVLSLLALHRAITTRSLVWIILACVVWFLGLLAKEPAVMALALAPMLLWRFGPTADALRQRTPGVRRVLVLLAVTATATFVLWLGLYIGLRDPEATQYTQHTVSFRAEDYGASHDSPWLGGRGPALGFLNFTRTTLTYAKLWLVPIGLSIHHWFIPSQTYADWRLWAGLLFLLAMGIVGVILWRRGSPVGAGLLWAGLGLAPVSQIIPAPEALVERYLYLPTAGVALAGAAVLLGPREQRASMKRDSRVVRYGILGALIVFYGTTTWLHSGVFRDDVTMNLNAYQQWQNAPGYTAMANIYLIEDRPAAAAAAADRALEEDPDYPEALRILGVLHCRVGRVKQGLTLLYRARELDPDDEHTQRAIDIFEKRMQRQ